MKTTTITRSDFSKRATGFGIYKITFQSPATGKKWSALVTDMEYIDAVWGTDEPTKKALIELRRLVKRTGNIVND